MWQLLDWKHEKSDLAQIRFAEKRVNNLFLFCLRFSFICLFLRPVNRYGSRGVPLTYIWKQEKVRAITPLDVCGIRRPGTGRVG